MPVFTVPRTSTAPSHPSNSPCPMRPFQEIYEWKPFYYHLDQTIRPQRITFFDLPYEIHLMIYKYVLSKDTCKFPFFDEIIDRDAENAEVEAEAAMADVMEDFVYGSTEGSGSDGSDFDGLAGTDLTLDELQEIHDMHMMGNFDDSDTDGELQLAFDEALEVGLQAEQETWNNMQDEPSPPTWSENEIINSAAASELSDSEEDDSIEDDGLESNIPDDIDYYSPQSGSLNNNDDNDWKYNCLGDLNQYVTAPGQIDIDAMMDDIVAEIASKPSVHKKPATDEEMEEWLDEVKRLISLRPFMGPSFIRGLKALMKAERQNHPPVDAFKLLKDAQGKPSKSWELDPDKYLNTDDVWGQLSLLRTCRFVRANFAPLLIPYLVRQTIDTYAHEVHRQAPYTYDLIMLDEASERSDLFARKKRHLLHWEQIDEDEIHADESANPEGYAGLTPFNQYAGWEFDEYEDQVHADSWVDWHGITCGQVKRPWACPWHLNSLIFTACHVEDIMGEFLSEYVKRLKEYQGGRWESWIKRDVMQVLVDYLKLDPWVERYLRREFELEGRDMRQTTMYEYMKPVDKNENLRE